MIFLSLLPAFLSILVEAVPPHLSETRVKHAWAEVPQGWEEDGAPSSDHPILLKIGLKQHRIGELIGTLSQVSDPLHPKYGNYLSRLYA